MTSDAKVGLLLGLGFIFIIAFVINGLPSLRDSENSNELTLNMVKSQNRQLGISMPGKIRNQIISPPKPAYKTPPAQATQNIRYKAPLPIAKAGNTGTKIVVISPPAAVNASPNRTRLSNQRALSKFHIVREGESLAVIARKFYGKTGNTDTNTMRIFKANRRILKSPDQIYVGQKLVIPSLTDSAGGRTRIENVSSSRILKKIKSISKHLPGGKGSQTKWYVVRQGDSLWRIADRQLGNANRYIKIAELNADILSNEDGLEVGMRLRIPSK